MFKLFSTKRGQTMLARGSMPKIHKKNIIFNACNSQKRHLKTDLGDNTMQWDFWGLSPESLDQITILFSNRAIPAIAICMVILRIPLIKIFFQDS